MGRVIAKWCRLGLVGGLVLSGLMACSEPPQPVRIGFVAGISGRVADLGIGGRNGALLAVEDINQTGGVNGRPVEMLVRDDGQDPEQVRRVVNDLIDAGVELIVGPMTSSMAMVAVEVADARQVPLVSPTATTTKLAGKDDYFFRAINTTTGYASKNAKFQYQNQGVRSAAAAIDASNRAYTESWYQDFKHAFEDLGGKMSHLEEFHSSAEVRFDQLAKRLMEQGADTILLVCNSVDAAVLIQQLRRQGYDKPIAVSEWASTERFVELGGTAVDGVLSAQFLDRHSENPRYVGMRDRFRQRFNGEPGFAGVAGYEAAAVALQALAQRKPDQSARDALKQLDVYEGLQAPLRFDAFGDAQRKTYISRIQNGQFVVIE